MQEIQIPRPIIQSQTILMVSFVAACAILAALVGVFPLQLSIISVFLFAGAHNLTEFRYFVARMPVRWGRSKLYYTVGIGGVIALTAFYLTIYFMSGNWLWSAASWTLFVCGWNTAFIVWVGSLIHLRGLQKPKSDWSWGLFAAFALAAVGWMVPSYFGLSIVYLHPFIAMWFLERQIRRTKPEWLRAYHLCLASIPICLIILWAALAQQPNLPEDTNLFWRINQHSGSGVLPEISSHLLVATHVFLETIHYSVWILLIPLVDPRAIPWRLSEIPLLVSRNGFPKLVMAALVLGALAVLVLWAGFAVDYTTTRDIYFALAIAHVMAEFPFLIKMM